MERNNLKEFLIEKGLFVLAIFSIIAIAMIIIFIFSEAFPIFEEVNFFSFLFGTIWDPSKDQYGVFSMIIGSFAVTGISILIAVPLSLLCAIFMEEIAPKKVKSLLKPIIQTLSGIPSVVYGFFGITVLVPFVRQSFGGTGFSVFTASCILAIMILPTIISISQDAIRTVPGSLKEASIGLGSTQWQTIRHVIFPVAFPGILTAIILGIGRALGETLAVMMVVGNVVQIPGSIFEPVRTLTTNIVLEMGYATGIHYNALFGTAVVLFAMIMALLLIVNYIQWRTGLKLEGEKI
ncbi:phosphate ABC transporter permease subunit PstC [uncultured Methanobrevibacter sp.]|uniref:phosphate ABC transporter permease subunit PstC n=1 Tax=uncultured Methanobrevibacter sp. TaxID=253161 RepID=UPI0026E0DABE|nr:phosphate ABC transporter permease subunit PstC [uncultured Methanobrevibacter sp.]